MVIVERNESGIAAADADTLPFNLRLGSLRSSRLAFSRLIREFGKGRISERMFKSTVWALGLYITYLRAEGELETDKRLDALERMFQEVTGRLKNADETEE